MFRQFLLGCLLLPAVAISQPVIVENKMICDITPKVLADIAKSNYNEMPLWIGEIKKDTKDRLAVIANEKTGTWTLIKYNDEIACLVAVGHNHKFVDR